MKRKALLAGASVIATCTAWTATASWIWCAGTGSPFQQLAWWQAVVLGWWYENWWCKLWIGLGAAGPTLAIALIAWLAGPLLWRSRRLRRPLFGGLKPLEEGVTENHGRAHWPTVAEMIDRFPNRGTNGIIIGEARRIDLEPCKRIPFYNLDPSTWGQGGTAQLLIDDTRGNSPHSVLCIGTGGGKSMYAAAVQYYWQGSIVMFDPSCELGPMMRHWRKKIGQRVVFIGKGPGKVGIDVLGCIQPELPDADTRIQSLVASMTGQAPGDSDKGGNNEEFRAAGRNIITCLIAHMMACPEGHPKNLQTLIDGITLPESKLKDVLKAIWETSPSPFARRLAGGLMETAQKTFSGACFSFSSLIGYMYDPATVDLLSGPVSPLDVLNGNISMYIQIPTSTLLGAPGIGRLIVDSIVNTCITADGNTADDILLQAEEARLLGAMKSMEIVLTMGRKYRLVMQGIYTSINDMRKIWTEDGLRMWMDNVSWAGFAAVTDETAKYLSERYGQRGILAHSEGVNSGSSGQGLINPSRSRGSNTNVHEISAPLIRPDDFADCRTDELFIRTRSGRGFRCGMALYYRRPEMAAEIDTTTFFKQPQRQAAE